MSKIEDSNNIPRTFWHSLSVAILIATIILSVIAYKSANISIEIANTKIHLSSAIDETVRITARLRAENTRLKKEHKYYIDKMEAIQSAEKNGVLESFDLPAPSTSNNINEARELVLEQEFDELELKLMKLKAIIRE